MTASRGIFVPDIYICEKLEGLEVFRRKVYRPLNPLTPLLGQAVN